MTWRRSVGLLIALICGMSVGAEEFALTVKNLSYREAQSSPGGYGGYGQVTTTKPGKLKQTPAATSSHPLYAQQYPRQAVRDSLRNNPEMVYYFDESQGTGKGYDRMIVDLNNNGDLTDDPVLERIEGDNQPRAIGYERAVFGPVEMPESAQVGQWRPRVYVEVFLYNKREIASGRGDNRTIGSLRIMTGNYLEADVQVNGVKQKFGVTDGNCNYRMGDGVTSSRIIRRPNTPGSWYMSPGDYFLRDRDHNGKFERKVVDSDGEYFSSLVYFGGKPFTVSLSDDLKTIRFAPYTEPLGDLSVKGDLVSLVLGWEKQTNVWEAITPDVVDGRARLPLGTYRLSSCTVGAKSAKGEWTQAQSNELPDRTYKISADYAALLDFGTPLTLTVNTEKGSGEGTQPEGMLGTLRNLIWGGSPASQVTVAMNVEIKGAGGETYSGFVGGKGGYVPPPKFQILDPDGVQVASGSFEYG